MSGLNVFKSSFLHNFKVLKLVRLQNSMNLCFMIFFFLNDCLHELMVSATTDR